MQFNLQVRQFTDSRAWEPLRRALPAAGLLAAAGLLLASMALVLLAPEPGGPPDGRTQRLSSYLMDTEFLLLSARNHRAALSGSEVLSPEIRMAVLQMTAAGPSGD